MPLEIRDDRKLAVTTFNQIKILLEQLSARERGRVIHSLLDDEKSGYQLLANFINDRLMKEIGASKAVDYLRYLAQTRTDPRFQEQEGWVTIIDDGV